MKKLNIKLEQDYKSFKTGFNYEFEGDLIILSGINGAGKSQIINMITSNTCSSLINNISLKKSNIRDRTFKNNISIKEISEASTKKLESICYAYTEDSLRYNGGQYDSLIKILKEDYGENNFNNHEITCPEIIQTITKHGLFFNPSDRFENTIGEIFFNHALKVSEKMKEVARNNFNENTFPKAPWKELNELFKELKFDYRFEENYEIVGIQINRQPRIYPLNPDGTLNMETSRSLNELSDGEKTIISLCFNALENTDTDTKVLLLDEIDATLNPSLIESFFTVIKRYYVDKGIMIVLTTHSSATIALAPSYAKFYEVFKANSASTRILQVDRESDYSEMKKVNEKFYTEIANQEERINQLKAKIDSEEKILIITEGKTDWRYILRALKYFHSINQFEEIKEEYFYRFGSYEDVNTEVCGTTSINELSESQLSNYLKSLQSARKIDTQTTKNIRIGIFDSDTNIKPINDIALNIYSFKIEPDNISTEFLFSNDEIKQTVINDRRLYIGEEFDKTSKRYDELSLGQKSMSKAGERVIIDCDVFDNNSNNIACSKDEFAQAIYNDEIIISDVSWNNFKHIFEKISSILNEANNDK